jgi:hypothetical protein
MSPKLTNSNILQVRGIVGGLTSCAAHISIFAVVKTYPLLSHLLGKHGVFTFYGLVSLFGKWKQIYEFRIDKI